MSDFRLKAVPALGGIGYGPIEIGGYRLEENPGLALASVASRNGESERVRSILGDMLGTTPPGPGKLSNGQGGMQSFWTGPDQWMVSAPHETHELLARELKDKFENAASVTEQNDAWACLEVSGPDLTSLLERLSAFDSQALHEGDAVRTVIEHVGCIVLCLETRRRCRMFAGRSFAHSLHHALQNGLKSTVALRLFEFLFRLRRVR